MSRHRKAWTEDDLDDYDDDYDDDYYGGGGGGGGASGSGTHGGGGGFAATSAKKGKNKKKQTPGTNSSSSSNASNSSAAKGPAPAATVSKAAPVGAKATGSGQASSIATVIENTTNAVGQMGLDSNVSTGTATPKSPTEDLSHAQSLSDDEATVDISRPASDNEEPLKPHVTVVVAGHVDAGKSTLVGSLLSIRGEISQRTIRKFEKQSQEIGKGSFALAWVMDESTAEREHGVTIDVSER
jgi:hypothetical protein